MNAERAAGQVVANDPTVASMVGSRVYSSVVPMGDAGGLPYVVLDTLDSEPRYYSGTGEANLLQTTVDVMCAGRTNQECIELVDAVREAVSNFTGRVDLPEGAWLIQSMRVSSYDKTMAPRQSGSENYVHVGTLTLTLWTSEV